MIYLHKILPLLISPLSLALFLMLYGWKSQRKWPHGLAMFLLIALSLPIVSHSLFSWLEGPGPKPRLEELPSADAIVVLSGMLATPEAVTSGYEWGDADRFFDGIAAFRAKKAPLLIFTGGRLPWDPSEHNEGERLAEKAIDWGIDSQSIRVTTDVQSTAEEAVAVKALLGPHSRTVLLITSAFHMPRAAHLFERQGFHVVPFPVDYKVPKRATTVMDFLPQVSALHTSSEAFREALGRLYYRWLG